MLSKIRLVTLKQTTRLLTLLLVIQMFISGEPAPSKKVSAKEKSEKQV